MYCSIYDSCHRINFIYRCNRRLYNICADKTLWNKVISTCDGKTPQHSYIFLNGHTTTSLELIKTVTSVNSNVLDTCFGIRFFRHLNKLYSLKRLTIVNHVIDGERVCIVRCLNFYCVEKYQYFHISLFCSFQCVIYQTVLLN